MEGYFITDYVSQMWYFSGGMRKAGVVPASSVVKAAWLATRYHLGTMILPQNKFPFLLSLNFFFFFFSSSFCFPLTRQQQMFI